VSRYFRLNYETARGRPVEELCEELRERLDDAVRVRMTADVPVGAFLSGGIDSSAVVAFMARHSPRPVKTFSIGFPGRNSSELPHARVVAKHFGTDHHELTLEPDVVSIVPSLAMHYGEPFADCSSVATWYLARLTREHVTVALSGDGGDEGFGGYQAYRFAHLARGIRALPAPFARTLSYALGRIRAPKLQRIRDFGRRLTLPEAERYLGMMAHFPHDDRLALYGPDMRARYAVDPIAAQFTALLDGATARDSVSRLMELDVETYLPNDILTKVDVASMAHALEVRCPLLDQDVMAFAASLPAGLKLRGLSTKVLLRRALRGILPPAILSRGKRGFDLPLDRWMRQELMPMTRDLLLDGTARSRGWFDPAAITRLFDAHARGESRGEQLWNLLVLETWLRGRAGAGSLGPAR
jgi:asparagine synthase (glutamine-hydrolysing)